MEIFLIIILVIGVIWFFKIYKDIKIPSIGCFCLVSGAPKTGKSTLSVALALKEAKKRRFNVWFYNLLHWKKKLPKPLIYSNVPLSVPYVPISKKLLLREERFVYGSVVYLQEASLVADSMFIKDMDINQQLLLLTKLIGHETKGGCLILDTQSISDLHYSFKKCLSNYLYIHKCYKTFFLPFVICKVRELFYSNDDSSSMNTFDKDIEESMKLVFVPKSTWKKFDCYCYSVLTDNLPVSDKEVKTTNLKANNIVSFRDFKSTKKGDDK